MTLEQVFAELVKGGPLAVIAGFLLWRVDKTLRELRDTVRDSVHEFRCKGGDTRVKEKP